MRRIQLEARARAELQWHREHNKSAVTRITRLIKDIRRDPFRGIGKPEPLGHDLTGLWSRRITKKERLVYAVTDEFIIIVSCRGHY